MRRHVLNTLGKSTHSSVISCFFLSKVNTYILRIDDQKYDVVVSVTTSTTARHIIWSAWVLNVSNAKSSIHIYSRLARVRRNIQYKVRRQILVWNTISYVVLVFCSVNIFGKCFTLIFGHSCCDKTNVYCYFCVINDCQSQYLIWNIVIDL